MQTIRWSLLIGGGVTIIGELWLQWAKGASVFSGAWGIAGTALVVLAGLGALEYLDRDSELHRDYLRDVEALARQDQLATLGRLAASVGHEIRNVISVAKMRLYLACQQTDGEVAEELETTAASINRLEELIEHLAPYADIENDLEPGFRLREAISGALDVVEPKTEDAVDLEVELRSNPGIAGNRATFTQVLINLLLNACDAVDGGGDGGRIRIRADRDGNEAKVIVVDDGPGIPPSKLDRIFDPFFTTKGDEHEGGTGIGLWLCRQLLDAHDATIRAENADDGGARFTVEIPVCPNVEPASCAAESSRQFPQQSVDADNDPNPPDDRPTDPRSPRNTG